LSEKVRISEDLYSKLKEIADKSGRSIRELVDEAVKAYILGFTGDKEIKATTGKIISLTYSTKCKRCGRELKEGELAYWSKITYTDNTSRSFVYCLDCYYSEGALAEYYLKKKKLEAVIKGLEKKANQLVEEITQLEALVDLYKLENEIQSYWIRLLELVSHEDKPNLNMAIEELLELIDKVKQLENTLKLGKGYRRVMVKKAEKTSVRSLK